MTEADAKSRRRMTRLTLLFAVIILTPSLIGFGMKFFEFVHTFRGQSDGAFAIAPMVNYLLASLGFLCLLIWSAINGMFHDIERPKQTMLEQDLFLDRHHSSKTFEERPRRLTTKG